MSSLLKKISPLDGFKRPLRCCISVDLPDPVCPIRPTNCPSGILRFTSIRAGLAMAVSSYFSDEKKLKEADGLYSELNIQAPVQNTEASENISGKTFVITGSVYHFSNRSELKEYIEERGGKVSGSVSAKTDYLINNDVTSTSGKNKKAKELGVSIISEEDFLNL